MTRRRADPGFRVRRDPAISRRKSGRLGGNAPREQVAVSEWLFWQMSGLGPMAGRPAIFASTRPRRSATRSMLYEEVNRLFGVMNKRLASHEACVGWA
jgi:GST-like protein